jgi:glutathione S-transferase
VKGPPIVAALRGVLAVNPAGFTPAIQDGYVTKSIAIMEYLMARYGPTRCTFQGR